MEIKSDEIVVMEEYWELNQGVLCLHVYSDMNMYTTKASPTWKKPPKQIQKRKQANLCIPKRLIVQNE